MEYYMSCLYSVHVFMLVGYVFRPITMTLSDLEAYFYTAELPQSLQLSPQEHITDLRKCVDGHISMLRARSGNKTFMPYYHRLVKIYQILLAENK